MRGSTWSSQYAGLADTTKSSVDPSYLEYSRFFAMEIYEKLQKGMDSVNTSGERIALPAQNIGSVSLQSLEPQGAARVSLTGYSGATWYPAAPATTRLHLRRKDTVVVHTIEGSAAGC